MFFKRKLFFLLFSSLLDSNLCMFNRIREKCPELLQVYLQSNLFKLPESEQGGDDFSNPTNMAKKYNIPYLGKLPMDPNMMRSCEEGKCFLEYFPTSSASKAFEEIIERLVTSVEKEKK